MRGFVWYTIGVLSFMYVLGIAGSLETGVISDMQAVLKAAIGLSILMFSFWRGDRSSRW